MLLTILLRGILRQDGVASATAAVVTATSNKFIKLLLKPDFRGYSLQEIRKASVRNHTFRPSFF